MTEELMLSKFVFAEPPKTALNKSEFNRIITQRSAFNLLQSASLEPEWKTVEELATVYQVELQKVYVLYEFIGNVYSHLNQLGCRVIGPLVVLQSPQMNVDFPMRIFPTWAQSLHGKHVTAVSSFMGDEEEIRDKVLKLGGVYQRSISDETSLIIVGIFNLGDVWYQESIQKHRIILKKEWLNEVYESASVNFETDRERYFLPDFISQYQVVPSSLTVTTEMMNITPNATVTIEELALTTPEPLSVKTEEPARLIHDVTMIVDEPTRTLFDVTMIAEDPISPIRDVTMIAEDPISPIRDVTMVDEKSIRTNREATVIVEDLTRTSLEVNAEQTTRISLETTNLTSVELVQTLPASSISRRTPIMIAAPVYKTPEDTPLTTGRKACNWTVINSADDTLTDDQLASLYQNSAHVGTSQKSSSIQSTLPTGSFNNGTQAVTDSQAYVSQGPLLDTNITSGSTQQRQAIVWRDIHEKSGKMNPLYLKSESPEGLGKFIVSESINQTANGDAAPDNDVYMDEDERRLLAQLYKRPK